MELSPLTLRIEKLGHMAVGIGRSQGKVVMVPFSAPGDLLEVEVRRSHKTYDEARILKILEPSDLRRDPLCSYYGLCGGCQLQHLHIAAQRAQKELILREMLRSSAMEGAMLEMASGERELEYRCRLDLHVVWERRPRLGLHKWASRDLVVLEKCLLAFRTINESLGMVQGLLLEAKERICGRIEVACDAGGEGISLFLSRTTPLSTKAKDRLKDAAKALPHLRSFCYRPLGKNEVEILGPGDGGNLGVKMEVGSERWGRWRLEVWPGVFSQVNPEVNGIMVDTLCSWTMELKVGSVLDLFAGMGNLSIPLSRLTSQVWAVEVDPRAVDNGIKNCQKMGIENISWIRGSAGTVVSELASQSMRFDLVVLDPPRSGAAELIRKLGLLQPKAIVYVSCDPPSLARDATVLQKEFPYRLVRVQPLDMFPQTYHLEVLALFLKH